MKIAKTIAQFCIGGSSYVGLELLYRGRSHSSMFCAGGICFLLLGKLRSRPLPGAIKAGAGAGIITGVELATGLLVNRDYHVWDYRQQPGNFLGQICPLFMVLWIPVTAAAMALYGWSDAALNRLLPSGA